MRTLSFCPCILDVIWAVCVYLSAMGSFCRLDSLSVNMEGPYKGLVASSATISRCIRQVVVRAYAVRAESPPFSVTAHSTREIGAFWAFQHQAPISQVYKVATWSFVHTFTKFYKVTFGHLQMRAMAARFCK